MFWKRKIIRILCAVMVGGLGMGCPQAFAHRAASKAPAKTADVPILLYHHIQDLPASISASKRRWSVPPKKFEEQMDWIASRGFHTVTVEQLMAHLHHGEALPPKPIILSFDDGWKDQYSVAFPVLKKHNFVATFFVITDSLDHSAYMNWQQIQELSAAGMDIQSHTLTHPRLSILPKDKARQEIAGSKKILESRLNKPVGVLAYPYGSYDDDVIALTKAAGYEGAVTVSGLNGGYFLRTDQCYTLSRYAVEWDDNLPSIAQWKHFDSD